MGKLLKASSSQCVELYTDSRFIFFLFCGKGKCKKNEPKEFSFGLFGYFMVIFNVSDCISK